MKGTILLNHNENTRQVEEEEKQRFLRTLLEQMQIPINDVWAADGPLSVDQTIKLRAILNTYRVQVIDDLDGHMQIFFIDDASGDYELVGEWHKCTYKLKRDLKQRDPRKQLYLEMEVNCWTLFEEQETPES
jgi:hypothetical protein